MCKISFIFSFISSDINDIKYHGNSPDTTAHPTVGLQSEARSLSLSCDRESGLFWRGFSRVVVPPISPAK